eukprot:CAMPEP_0194032030 /NCGR_PEP_ID=MMETSP0009_2-20130614/5070_1 /TAXON_ID=210454 /ORGANISM="Grammatophora oceanica, Strain CCMP 410" /LENGTH=62 /DNA_ID=CAMNT_0038672351 /DNA_START=47 /DNA_END=231 /DNA_ORIENTATION=+
MSFGSLANVLVKFSWNDLLQATLFCTFGIIYSTSRSQQSRRALLRNDVVVAAAAAAQNDVVV